MNPSFSKNKYRCKAGKRAIRIATNIAHKGIFINSRNSRHAMNKNRRIFLDHSRVLRPRGDGKEVISSSSSSKGLVASTIGDVPVVEYSYSEPESDWEVGWDSSIV